MSAPKLPAITRPDGSTYRPRKISTVTLGDEDEITDLVVFGTHDVRFARLHAVQAANDAANEFYSNEYRLEVSEEAELVWYSQSLAHFEHNVARYRYSDSPTKGRAGVRFDIKEVEVRP